MRARPYLIRWCVYVSDTVWVLGVAGAYARKVLTTCWCATSVRVRHAISGPGVEAQVRESLQV